MEALLTPGKKHSSGHAKDALGRLLDELGDKAAALVRGACAYGNEDIIDVCEQRNRPYLFRLRKTANVKRFIERLFRRDGWTSINEAARGWQAIKGSLQLQGWSKSRRVVVLRRRINDDLVLTKSKAGDEAKGKP